MTSDFIAFNHLMYSKISPLFFFILESQWYTNTCPGLDFLLTPTTKVYYLVPLQSHTRFYNVKIFRIITVQQNSTLQSPTLVSNTCKGFIIGVITLYWIFDLMNHLSGHGSLITYRLIWTEILIFYVLSSGIQRGGRSNKSRSSWRMRPYQAVLGDGTGRLQDAESNGRVQRWSQRQGGRYWHQWDLQVLRSIKYNGAAGYWECVFQWRMPGE